MYFSQLTHSFPLSPHKVFQFLSRAVRENDHQKVEELVNKLIDMMSGKQSLAAYVIDELIAVAEQGNCHLEIIKSLTRIPGFKGTNIENVESATDM